MLHLKDIEGIFKNQSKADQANISEKDTGQQKINHGAKTQLNPIQSLNLQGDSANNFQEPQTPRSTFVDVSAQQQIKALQSQVSQLIQCLTEQQAQKNWQASTYDQSASSQGIPQLN